MNQDTCAAAMNRYYRLHPAAGMYECSIREGDNMKWRIHTTTDPTKAKIQSDLYGQRYPGNISVAASVRGILAHLKRNRITLWLSYYFRTRSKTLQTTRRNGAHLCRLHRRLSAHIRPMLSSVVSTETHCFMCLQICLSGHRRWIGSPCWPQATWSVERGRLEGACSSLFPQDIKAGHVASPRPTRQQWSYTTLVCRSHPARYF